jgi:two-component system, LytTR family, sensor kinase
MATSRVAYDTLAKLALTRRPAPREEIARALRRIAIGLVAASVIAILFAAQNYTFAGIEGQARNWWRSLQIQLIVWYSWAALVPFIVALAARWPLVRHGKRQRIALWLLAAVVFAGLHAALSMTALVKLHVLPPPPGIVPSLWYGISVRFQGTAAANLLYFTMIALAIHFRASVIEARDRDAREMELTARLAEAELHVLKAQLQPHFFFNTLNTVSALMETDVPSARTVMANLGDLLRLSMHGLASDEMALAEEFAFLEKYLAIQRARYGARLQARLENRGAGESLVPSLILQPLVENAIRYAIETRRAPGIVRVSATRVDDRLRLEVDDDGPGLPHDVMTGLRQGVGLRNTEARLEQLYGQTARFEVGASPLGGARVLIEIPFRTPPCAPLRTQAT